MKGVISFNRRDESDVGGWRGLGLELHTVAHQQGPNSVRSVVLRGFGCTRRWVMEGASEKKSNSSRSGWGMTQSLNLN